MMAGAVTGSSTEEKARILPPLLQADDVALIVEFGTAATSGEASRNGSVVCGTNVFLHDANVGNSESHWPIPRPDVVLTSKLSGRDFAAFASDEAAANVAKLALMVPNTPAAPGFLADHEFVALADINVTDYHNYAVADKAVVDAYVASGSPQPNGSLETTHGVIRECASDAKPFMFVSGITDRIGHFDEDVGKAVCQQNFVAAHNAGIAVAPMIPAILKFLSPA